MYMMKPSNLPCKYKMFAHRALLALNRHWCADGCFVCVFVFFFSCLYCAPHEKGSFRTLAKRSPKRTARCLLKYIVCCVRTNSPRTLRLCSALWWWWIYAVCPIRCDTMRCDALSALPPRVGASAPAAAAPYFLWPIWT